MDEPTATSWIPEQGIRCRECCRPPSSGQRELIPTRCQRRYLSSGPKLDAECWNSYPAPAQYGSQAPPKNRVRWQSGIGRPLSVMTTPALQRGNRTDESPKILGRSRGNFRRLRAGAEEGPIQGPSIGPGESRNYWSR